LDSAGADTLSSLGANGLDEYTQSMEVVNGSAYATVLDQPFLYRWNPATSVWDIVNVGNAVSGNFSSVAAVAHSGTNLFMGGNFIDVGSTRVNNVTRQENDAWVGLSWSP